MNSRLRLNQRGPNVVQPRSRLGPGAPTIKKNILRPISSKTVQNAASVENETETQPISDFPSPPVQIVSCHRTQQGEMPMIPNIGTAPHGEISILVIQKLKLCQRSCDFSDPRADAGGKATKRATLNELIDLYTNPKMLPKLTRECHQQLIEMFAINIFRPPPSVPRALMVSDEVTIEDTAWPHLQLIYLLFLKFLDCGVEQRILQFQLSPKFISSLFSILDFPDERERTQVRSVIASIYKQVPPQRTLLINITINLLMNVPEDLEINAASHLLELFYLFTSDAPLPLSQQLINAFDHVLLPLHLTFRCKRYFEPLVKCILSMIRKDARLGNNLLQFLIGHWPLTLDHKSELFINEISQVIDDINTVDLQQNIKSLFERITIAAESPCTTLADKALKFLSNNTIQNMIVENAEPLLDILFPPLFRITCGHWQKTLQLAALKEMNCLMELVPEEFKAAAETYKENSLYEKTRKMRKKNLWEDVAKVAAKNFNTIDSEEVDEELTAFFGIHETRVNQMEEQIPLQRNPSLPFNDSFD